MMVPGSLIADGRPCLVRASRFGDRYFVVDPHYIVPPTEWGLQPVGAKRSCCYCTERVAEYVNTMAGLMSAMCMPCLVRREGEGILQSA